MSENSAFTITGVSASSGRSTKPTAASTSAKAFCISLPNLNSITELALPSKEVELTDFTFSIARNSGSNDWIMLESISSAVAPDHDIVMPIMSTDISGKNCLFIRPAESTPTKIIKIMIKFAAVRCLTKNFMISVNIKPNPHQ